MLTAVVLDGLEGGVRTDAPIVVADLVADVDCGKTAAEGDAYAVLVKVFGRAVAKMSNATNIAQVIEEDVVPAFAGFGVVEVKCALFCVKIVLHICFSFQNVSDLISLHFIIPYFWIFFKSSYQFCVKMRLIPYKYQFKKNTTLPLTSSHDLSII